MQDAYIVNAVRTPIGKAHRGGFRNTSSTDLLAHVLENLVKSHPELIPSIEDVIVGCAMPEGEQGMNIGRIGSLLAGYPDHVPGFTVNRLCSSGLQAVAIAADRVRLGECDLIVAGGVESMSLIPMVGNHPRFSPLVFEKKPEIVLGMGITAENVAHKYNVSREDQDKFSLESHLKALAAKEEFKSEIVPMTVKVRTPPGIQEITISEDEGPRKDSTLESLSQLKPAFSLKGSVTAGNSSQMSDGAAAVLICNEKTLKKYNLTPMARFLGFSIAGVPPAIMGIGPILAIPKVLERTGLKLQDIDWIELNEAFASQSLAVIREVGLDPSKVNPLGGAIALGHPLGATGAIKTVTAVHALKRRQQRYAMVTMCIGVGMGAAGIFESVS